MRATRAQIQTTETIFSVFIIIIIITLGIVFYSRVQETNLREAAREQRILRLVSLAHAISNWPELDCSTLESREFDCVDRVKIAKINEYMNASRASDGFAFRYYSDLMGRSSVVVREMYSKDALQSWVVFNNSLRDGTKDSVSVPVNVYDPVGQTYTFAIMDISVYE